jgi:hypothetical protein
MPFVSSPLRPPPVPWLIGSSLRNNRGTVTILFPRRVSHETMSWMICTDR